MVEMYGPAVVADIPTRISWREEITARGTPSFSQRGKLRAQTGWLFKGIDESSVWNWTVAVGTYALNLKEYDIAKQLRNKLIENSVGEYFSMARAASSAGEYFSTRVQGFFFLSFSFYRAALSVFCSPRPISSSQIHRTDQPHATRHHRTSAPATVLLSSDRHSPDAKPRFKGFAIAPPRLQDTASDASPSPTHRAAPTYLTPAPLCRFERIHLAPLTKRQCFLLIVAGSLSRFFLDHLFESFHVLIYLYLLEALSKYFFCMENGHSSMYTWILSTGWWKNRAPIDPDAL
ncbi:uvrB/uvrC motif-containing protein [Striga asiatica]|uniref:UvrB/uvrC motif-containing protein n=1 Tax=Striga asiatica TaxID=4170 RepID=A0A5A7RI44_STRAF|nr:uvrB/uvrC motif-containing protein [Striga asiatica]